MKVRYVYSSLGTEWRGKWEIGERGRKVSGTSLTAVVPTTPPEGLLQGPALEGLASGPSKGKLSI